MRLLMATSQRCYASRNGPSFDVKAMKSEVSAMAKESGGRNNTIDASAVDFEIAMPGTFVALPMAEAWRASPTPAVFLTYQYHRLKTWAQDRLALFSVKWLSMPSLRSRPQFKIQRSKIAPTAKALHRSMSEAVAAGDLKTLREVCVPNLYNQLSGTIARRKPGERVEWQLVGYDGAPRLASHRIFSLSEREWSQQATVGIRSTQRLARYDRKTGELVPGSLRLQTKTEFVIVTRRVNATTWQPSPWRIWGTRAETTMEAWTKETELLKQLQNKQTGQQAKKLLSKR